MRKPVAQPHGMFHLHRTVSDMKRSIDFYVTVLGFYYVEGVPEVAWLTHGGVLLTLAPGEPQFDPGNYCGWTVGSLAELEALYDRLHSRYQPLSAPPDPAAGRSYFFLYDPDGYPLAFSYQPLE